MRRLAFSGMSGDIARMFLNFVKDCRFTNTSRAALSCAYSYTFRRSCLYALLLAATYATARSDEIAFFYALDADLQGIKSKAHSAGKSFKVGSRSVTPLYFEKHRVYAVKMGSGAVDTAVSAEALLARVSCDTAISVGPAGALSDELRVGRWYSVGKVIPYQKGSWTKNGFQIGTLVAPGLKPDSIAASNLPPLFCNVSQISVASGETFVASDTHRTELRDLASADAVDMNLFGLVTACASHNVPVLCWRIISDRADDSAGEDFRNFVAKYDGSGGKAIAELVERLPISPNSPAAYPNLRKLLPSGEITNSSRARRPGQFK